MLPDWMWLILLWKSAFDWMPLNANHIFLKFQVRCCQFLTDMYWFWNHLDYHPSIDQMSNQVSQASLNQVRIKMEHLIKLYYKIVPNQIIENQIRD